MVDMVDLTDTPWHWMPDPTFRIKRVREFPDVVTRSPRPKELCRANYVLREVSVVNYAHADSSAPQFAPGYDIKVEHAHERFINVEWHVHWYAMDARDGTRVEFGHYTAETDWVWLDDAQPAT